MSSFPSGEWVESAATALAADEQFARTSRAFSTTIRFDFGETACAFGVDEGEVTVYDDPELVSWAFALRAPETVWQQMLSETPPAPYHDLLGAWLRGDLVLEGDLKTAIQHLRPLKRTLKVFREVDDE